MTIEELNKTYKELEEVSKSSDKYFYSKIQDFAREVENFYYQDKSQYKKTAEFIIDTYKKILPKVESDTFGYKLAKDDLTRVFLEIAGFGIGKGLNVQKHFIEVFKKELSDKKLVDLIIKTLQKYLELQGTETSLSGDGKSMGITSFQVNLNKQVRGIRKQVHQLLLKIAKENKTNYSIVIDVITAIRNNIHSLAVILQNDKRAEAQQIISQELTESIKILEAIIKQYDGTKIEHLNIYHEISLAFWDPYEEDWEIKNITEAKELKKEIWSDNNYLLFKAILRPGFKFTENIPNIAAKFSVDDIELLEQIIQFAENEKSIYNSIKTFFYYLGQNPVFSEIIQRAQNNPKSPLWYYLGFGFSNIKNALDFGNRTKPNNIIKIKATIDAFYHAGYLPENKKNQKSDWQKQPDTTKKEVYGFLAKQIKLGTEFIKKDQTEIFWWSSSVTNTAQQVFDAKFSKESLALFEAILDDFSEKEEYSNYLFNAVANSIFYLREKLTPKDKDSLDQILKKFEKTDEISQNMEMFLEVVAKTDALLLVEFYKKRLMNKSLKSDSLKRIPYSHKFIFNKVKKLGPDKVNEILKNIAKLHESDKKKLRLANISRLFVDFAESTELGIDYAIEWLKNHYIAKTGDEKKAINAVQLLEDYDDYSNENFWDFLKSIMLTFDSKEVRSAIWGTYISGSIDQNRIVQKEKHLKNWLDSGEIYLIQFAENELVRLQKEKEEWVEIKGVEGRNIVEINTRSLREFTKSEIESNNQSNLILTCLSNLASSLKYTKRDFEQYFQKSYHPREEFYRSIFFTNLRQYFMYGTTETQSEGGKIDIDLADYKGSNMTFSIECLRWLTGRSKSKYHEKIEKVKKWYSPESPEGYIITFYDATDGNIEVALDKIKEYVGEKKDDFIKNENFYKSGSYLLGFSSVHKRNVTSEYSSDRFQKIFHMILDVSPIKKLNNKRSK